MRSLGVHCRGQGGNSACERSDRFVHGEFLDRFVRGSKAVLVGEGAPSGVGDPLGVVVRGVVRIHVHRDGEPVSANGRVHVSMVAREAARLEQ